MSTWNYDEAIEFMENLADAEFSKVENKAYQECSGNELIEIRSSEDGTLISAFLVEEFEQS